MKYEYLIIGILRCVLSFLVVYDMLSKIGHNATYGYKAVFSSSKLNLRSCVLFVNEGTTPHDNAIRLKSNVDSSCPLFTFQIRKWQANDYQLLNKSVLIRKTSRRKSRGTLL